MLQIKTFYCNPFRECTYIVSTDENAQTCVIIDPGMYGEKEEKRVLEYLTEHHLVPEAVLITHEHPDHVCGLEFVQQHFPKAKVVDYKTPSDNAAGLTFKMLYTPGHKEDSVCYYFESEGIIFTGDTLFQESVGRTDLPGGDMNQLMQSLAQLMQLPEKTEVYPGHGYTTTIGYEKRNNPCIGD